MDILFAWLGKTDLRAAEGDAEVGAGPVLQALRERRFDRLCLLSNHDREAGRQYARWLAPQVETEIEPRQVRLTSPTDYGSVYEAARAAVDAERERAGSRKPRRQFRPTFHTSPGTPAMAAVWILLAQTRCPAKLIESSREHGVRDVVIPFEIAADYVPELRRQLDEDAVRLAAGEAPAGADFQRIVHRSPEMRDLLRDAAHVAPREVPVLLLGETGTGKEMLARAIHGASSRKGRPFVAVNCGAIPRELAESELFGHARGAFTGASRERRGHIEEADGGTLFLDEIGETPPDLQVKLLRVLQEKTVTPVGATASREVDFRLVCATHRDLIADVAAGRFREDLFHRIAVADLRLPPLRERRGDVALLLDRFLEEANRKAGAQPGHEDKRLSAGARNLLLGHAWPGNVRELENTVVRLVLWTRGPLISVDDVRRRLLPLGPPRGETVLNRPLGEDLCLPDLMAGVARHYLSRAMDEAGGRKTRAAEMLGFNNYQTLSNWLEKYGAGGPGEKNHKPGG